MKVTEEGKTEIKSEACADYGLVSIIMPNYNSAKYVEATINSILAQTYKNWELIFVDDCSTDNSMELVKAFNDERIKVFQNEKNSGAAISRNYALRMASGKWMAFLDSDDLWEEEKLAKQLAFMVENNYDFTYTHYRVCNEGVWENFIRVSPKKVTLRKLYNYCYFSTITVIYNKEKVGLVQIPDIKKRNDYALWLVALKNCDAYLYPEVMSYYIRHGGSLSTVPIKRLIKYHYQVFHNVLGHNAVLSTLMVLNNLFHGFIKKNFYKKKIEDSVK
ncbi:MAG: glycosyltransferase family 2 protein [Clostridia bacterium]|nr:glycosyltransferase family 2 protein [Clostridia bacterium]